VKLAHIADPHLGIRQYHRQTSAGINQREADIAQAFRAAIDGVIAARPDAVVVAGDLFHSVRPSNSAIVFAFRQFQRLRDALPSAPIVLIAGNHDTPRSVETGSILRLFEELNVDVATIDHYIDAEVATGKVDTRRIYVTGWSNGAAMGFLYGLNRTGIAAAAVYTAPNPFEAFNDPCPQTPVSRRARSDGEIRLTNKRLPVYHVHNACDIAGICPNGELLLSQLLTIRVRFTDLIINDDETPAMPNVCDAACGTNPDADVNFADNPEGYTRGSQNHTRWPKSQTQGMLDFFRAHGGHARWRPISQP